MRKILITGEVGAGKSHLAERLLNGKTVVFGFCTKKEAREADGIERVYIHPARGERFFGDENCVAVSDVGSIKKTAMVDVFNNFGVKLLSDIPENALVLMDELGILEGKAESFVEKVNELFGSDRRIIAVIKKKQSQFLDALRARDDIICFELTAGNRDEIFERASGFMAREWQI